MLPPVWNYPFTYRAVKGSPLSNTEVDDNFKAVAERAEYAQTVAETLPNEIALTAADAATYTANQIASTIVGSANVNFAAYLDDKIKQTSGASTTDIMSQKAVTDYVDTGLGDVQSILVAINGEP